MTPKRLKYHFAWLLVGWALVGTVIYLSLTSRPIVIGVANADKYMHMLAYGTLMFWFAQLYRAARTRYLYAVGFSLMGALMEVLQQLGTVRTFDWFDMLANITGVCLVLLVWLYRPVPLLRWVEGLLHRGS